MRARVIMLRLNANPSVAILFSETLQVAEQRNELEIENTTEKTTRIRSPSGWREKLNLLGISFCHDKYLQ